MDYTRIIRDLRSELERVEQAIKHLESLAAEAADSEPKRRGRKFMSPEERKTVSARMKNYWAARRSAAKA